MSPGIQPAPAASPPRGPLRMALVAFTALALAALRHVFVWGGGRPVLGVELHVWLGIGEGVLLCAFAGLGSTAYLAALRAAQAGTLDERMALRSGLVLTAVAFAIPHFLSSDLYDYLLRGRVEAVHGANPYTTAPGAFPADPLLAMAQWPEWAMPYGPVQALVQWAVAALAGESAWLGAYLFKALFAACHVATALVLRAACTGPSRAVALTLWLWNPALLLESATHGHNEALMVLFLACAAGGIARSRVAAGTLAFGLAVLTKHGCAVLGPLLLACAWRQGRLGSFLLGAAGSIALTVPAVLHWFLAPGGLDWLTRQTANRGTSLQHFAGLALGADAARPLLLAGYAVLLAALARACLRTRDARTLAHEGTTLVLVLLLVAMPLFSPWYHLWWLPLAGAALTPRLVGGLLAVAVCVPLSYVVYATTRSFGLDHQLWQWTVGLAVPSALILRRRAAPDPG